MDFVNIGLDCDPSATVYLFAAAWLWAARLASPRRQFVAFLAGYFAGKIIDEFVDPFWEEYIVAPLKRLVRWGLQKVEEWLQRYLDELMLPVPSDRR